jgi:hypothetical protein
MPGARLLRMEVSRRIATQILLHLAKAVIQPGTTATRDAAVTMSRPDPQAEARA